MRPRGGRKARRERETTYSQAKARAISCRLGHITTGQEEQSRLLGRAQAKGKGGRKQSKLAREYVDVKLGHGAMQRQATIARKEVRRRCLRIGLT